MPDTHEGPDFSPEPPPQGDLSDSTGSQFHFEKNLTWQCHPSDATRLRLTLQMYGGSTVTRVPQRSTNWARLGQSIWRAHRDAFDVPLPPRDVPAWLSHDPSPPECFSRQLVEGPPQGPVLDDALPLHFGIDLRPSSCRGRAEACSSANAAGCTLRNSLNNPLLQFPVTVLPAPALQPPAPVPFSAAEVEDGVLQFRAPVRQTIAVFSLTGGTGRTSLAAGLARLLAGTGLRVMLVDTSAFSLLPRLFGSEESRQGVVRSFFPSSGEKNRAISLLSVAVEPFAGDDYEQYRILEELAAQAARVDRVVWDLSGAPLDWAAKVLGASPQILVPLLPSTHSLMQLRATERFLNRCHDEEPSAHLRYVLNHFDEHDPLHNDMRDQFQKRLGTKLLRVSLRRSPLVDEALSCGKTVIDHAPESSMAQDLWQLAQQLHQVDESADPQGAVTAEWFEH